MSHDPMPNGAPPAAGSQAGGAGVLAPGELREQLFKEFYEKCRLYVWIPSIVFKEKSVVKRAFDLYGFIVFNKTFDKYAESATDADISPPEQLIREIVNSMPSITAERIRTYAREFNDFKAESARRVMEVCEKIGKRKLKRFNAITAEAVKSMYELAAKENRENVKFELELQAKWLAEMRVKEYLSRPFAIQYNVFPDDIMRLLPNIERRIVEGIDKGRLAETLAKELRKIAREELKVRRREALQLTSFLSA